MNPRRLISLAGSSAVLAGCIDRGGEADGAEGGSDADGTGEDERMNSPGDEGDVDSDSSDDVETDDATGTNGSDNGTTGGGEGTNGSDSDGDRDSEDDGVADGETREPAECDGSLRPLAGPFDEAEYERIETTGGQTFELVADPETVALGEELSVVLRWVDDDSATTGNDEKFTVERRTGDGWEPIYRLPEHGGWNDVGIAKLELSPPATWFEWSFELTVEGTEQNSTRPTRSAIRSSRERIASSTVAS